MEILASLKLSNKLEDIGNNLRICYQKLIEAAIIPQQESELVDLWLKDLANYKNIKFSAIET